MTFFWDTLYNIYNFFGTPCIVSMLPGVRPQREDGDRAASGGRPRPRRQEHRHLRGQAHEGSPYAARSGVMDRYN